MSYLVICRFYPEVSVFGKAGALRKGAWRVESCYRSEPLLVTEPTIPFISVVSFKLLRMYSIRPRQVGSWCSPRKILNEWLDACRTTARRAA